MPCWTLELQTVGAEIYKTRMAEINESLTSEAIGDTSINKLPISYLQALEQTETKKKLNM